MRGHSYVQVAAICLLPPSGLFYDEGLLWSLVLHSGFLMSTWSRSREKKNRKGCEVPFVSYTQDSQTLCILTQVHIQL